MMIIITIIVVEAISRWNAHNTKIGRKKRSQSVHKGVYRTYSKVEGVAVLSLFTVAFVAGVRVVPHMHLTLHEHYEYIYGYIAEAEFDARSIFPVAGVEGKEDSSQNIY
jgi:hypothetical protein